MPKTTEQLKIENTKALVELYVQMRRKGECETSLRAFVKNAWSYVEPGVPYVHGWHIDAICEHLEAVNNGEIRKLIINVPPRTGKSTICSVLFPAWVWITAPQKKFLYASFGLHLSMRDSRKCRTLIGSTWYQRNWADRFAILTAKGGQDTKQRFDNDKGGVRESTATNVGTTGAGGNIIFYDDPNDLNQMSSEPYIQQVINFHEIVMGSRLDDPKTGARVLIQQRSSERDLTGHILETDKTWDHLVIPMEYEGPRKLTSIGWEDPRKQIGQLMCPDRIGPEECAQLKKHPIRWAGQYQQTPSPGEGAKFKREWWNFYNPPGVETLDPSGKVIPIRIKHPGTGEITEKIPIPCPPAFEQVVQAWDMAFKNESENDFVSGQAWGRVGANVMLLKRDTRRMDFPETLSAVRQMSAEFPCPEKLVEGKANGPAVIQTLKNEIPGMIESPINQGLLELATSMTGYAEAGNIYFPNPNLYPWVWDLIEQFAVYPRGKHDDDVAAAAHAWRRLFDSVANSAAPEFRVIPRLGEPQSACHVVDDHQMRKDLPAHWRRWIAVAPGQMGAAIWFAETPQGSIRVYRELLLDNVDAHEAGRLIMEQSLPDIRAYMKVVHLTARWNIDVLMDKECFTPIEPIGCYAELLEQGLLGYNATGSQWEEREQITEELKLARFSSQMAEPMEVAFERLRDLLKFKPEDYEEVSYDRAKAIRLADEGNEKYFRYMAAVEGRVVGEWPKIKFSSECRQTIASLGAARRTENIVEPFLRALLTGIAAPPRVSKMKKPQETPWPAKFKMAGRKFNRRLA